MAVCEMSWASKSLGKQSKATIIVPQNGSAPFPVMYLLHGRGDDHTNWVRNTSLERYAADLPLLIVMPDGARGFYSDSATNPLLRYESLVANDLIEFVDTTFQTLANRENRVIAGLSMGGYGAIKLALKYPHLYGAAVGHSGVYDIARRSEWLGDDEAREATSIFGDSAHNDNYCDNNDVKSDNDVFALAQKRAHEYSNHASNLPLLRFDCGVDDFLLDDNRRLHTHLQNVGIPHQYEEHAGAHDWNYWDTHIQDTLQFFARYLQIATQ